MLSAVSSDCSDLKVMFGLVRMPAFHYAFCRTFLGNPMINPVTSFAVPFSCVRNAKLVVPANPSIESSRGSRTSPTFRPSYSR
jgi:hypothetical protein